ncbi:MAG TPA: hypothetical protein VK646_11735 [Actinomycetota bacterium]|nr:hypothetical protein [Actinomycetota bacterium]
MPELRDLLEREMGRTGIEPLTLEDFLRRRDAVARRRRITAAILAIAVAVAATGVAVRAFDRAQAPTPATYPLPPAGSIAFVEYRHEAERIDALDPATGRVTTVMDLGCERTGVLARSCPGVSIEALDASPDGSQLVFAAREAHQPSAYNTTWTMTSGLYLFDLRTHVRTKLVDCPSASSCVQVTSPAWSPDGTTIAYTAIAPNGTSIRLVDLDGSDDRPVDVGTLSNADSPSWFPDGSRILFSATPYHGPQVPGLYSIEAGGGEPDPIDLGTIPRAAHVEVAGLWAPSLSPDGTTVVFHADPGGPRSWFWVGRIGGQAARRIPGLGTEQGIVSWMPDSSRIVVIADGRLQLVDPWTGSRSPVTHADGWVSPVVLGRSGS